MGKIRYAFSVSHYPGNDTMNLHVMTVLRKVLREFHHWCCGWNLEALKGQLTWGWPSHFAHQWQKWHWPNDQWCVPLFHEPQNLEEMLVTSPMMRSLGGVETCKLENCKDTDSWGTNLLNVLLLLHRCERCWLKCSQAFPRNWWEVFTLCQLLPAGKVMPGEIQE